MATSFFVYGSWVYERRDRKVYRMGRDGSVLGELLVVEGGEVHGIVSRSRTFGSFCPLAVEALDLAEALASHGEVHVIDANMGMVRHSLRALPSVVVEVDGAVVLCHEVLAPEDAAPEVASLGGPLGADTIRIRHLGLQADAVAARERQARERLQLEAVVAWRDEDPITEDVADGLRLMARKLLEGGGS